MKCLQFQSELNADPRHLSYLARKHAEECPDCARRLVKQLNLEASMVDSLQVAIPDGLDDRILLNTRFSHKKYQTLYAVAATVLLSVVIALAMPFINTQAELDMAIEHVLAEPKHLIETKKVSAEQVNKLLARVGAHSETMLPVSYAGTCDLPNGKGGHIVLNTNHGRVTLMLMPDGKSGVVEHKERNGVIAEMYAARNGNYSLIASSSAALKEAKSLLASRLQWSTRIQI